MTVDTSAETSGAICTCKRRRLRVFGRHHRYVDDIGLLAGLAFQEGAPVLLSGDHRCDL